MNDDLPALEPFLRAIPKAELHCHLFGTVRHETFADLNRRAGSPLAEDEVPGGYTRGEKPVGAPELFEAAYALARRGGLKAAAHAGDFGMPWTNVRTALDVLKVDRIDHGYTVGFMLNGIDPAWVDPSQQARWRSLWSAEFDALRDRLLPDSFPPAS